MSNITYSAEANEVRGMLRAMIRLNKIAEKKMIPWSPAKPMRRGVWIGVKWQHAGFYHVMIYEGRTCKYLRQQPDEFWSGPYPQKEEWMKHVTVPSPPTGKSCIPNPAS